MILKSRIQYIMTWVCLGVLILSAVFLMIVSWNSGLSGRGLSGRGLSALTLLFWVLISASGIYLFMLAVKKAHRLMVDEERRLRREAEELNIERRESRHTGDQESREFDFTAIARKLVRRIPEGEGPASWGDELLHNLASELEIMSGIVWVKKKDRFVVGATYALPLAEEPAPFRDGEGLHGQVAVNQAPQILTRLPEDHLKVYSGLGRSAPSYLAIVPIVKNHRTLGILECSGFKFSPGQIESMCKVFTREISEKLSKNKN
jgi:hypothetical protein